VKCRATSVAKNTGLFGNLSQHANPLSLNILFVATSVTGLFDFVWEVVKKKGGYFTVRLTV
jgi:hypothetical protein